MDINDITYIINGAVFEINKVLGSGFLEKVYENAMIESAACIVINRQYSPHSMPFAGQK